jgi:hypothetical protein
MKLTSQEAGKMLKKLNEKIQSLLLREKKSSSFLASVGEDPETCRPEYDYASAQKEIRELELRVRKLRHALNVFNTTHTVPGFEMTIDEMLVYIPQLTKQKEKLDAMKSELPKSRVEPRYGSAQNFIDYKYLNYSIKEAEADYERVSSELSKAQTALDLVNSTESFDIDL